MHIVTRAQFYSPLHKGSNGLVLFNTVLVIHQLKYFFVVITVKPISTLLSEPFNLPIQLVVRDPYVCLSFLRTMEHSLWRAALCSERSVQADVAAVFGTPP